MLLHLFICLQMSIVFTELRFFMFLSYILSTSSSMKFTVVGTTYLAIKDGLSYSTTHLSINFEGKLYTLDLQPNEVFLSTKFSVTNFSFSGEPHFYEAFGREENECYYQGTVRGINESKVIASTCNGLKGVIILPNDFLVIKPMWNKTSKNSPKRSYIVYRPHDSNHSTYTCTTLTADDGINHFIEEYSDASDKFRVVSGDKKFMELMIVTDLSMVKKFGDELLPYIKEVANYVDGLFQELHIRVVLSHVEIWNDKNKVALDANAFHSLANLRQYRKARFFTDPLSSPWVSSDVVHLLTASEFQGKTIGVSQVGALCGAYAVGIDLDLTDPFTTASTVTHELGHNFGMRHDESHCGCPAHKECLMEARARFTEVLTWSSCSRDHLERFSRQGKDACLSNVPGPSKLYSGSTCGNDIVDYGEECDCGFPQFCKSQCCDPTKCLFRSGAQCDLGGCCKDCRYVKRNTICRLATSECDVEEYCNGVGPYCPPDTYKQDGSTCLQDSAVCRNGACLTRDALCQSIWGPDSSSADDVCYDVVNSYGNLIGNCGEYGNGHFRPCKEEHSKCGKLQCDGGSLVPMLSGDQSAYTNTLTRSHGVVICKTTVAIRINVHVKDPGLVPSGISCGKGKVCNDGFCVNHSAAECSSQCFGRGVCNNLGNCHCDVGWAPPYCNETGVGGSFDNGRYGTIFYGPIATPYSSIAYDNSSRETFEIIAGITLAFITVGLIFYLACLIYTRTRITEGRKGSRKLSEKPSIHKSDRSVHSVDESSSATTLL